MKNKVLSLNKILIICTILCLVCYDIYGGLWLKGTTSLWFVLLGIVNLIYAFKQKCKNIKFVILIVLGLIFGMLADVLLGLVFVFGILSFALGHICYLLAYYTLEKFKIKELYITIPLTILAIFVITGTPFITISDPTLKVLLIGYAAIISCMLSKAINNYKSTKSNATLLVLIASAMFFFSDFILAIDMFGTSSRLTWILCSYVYWPSQSLLAHSLYYFTNENKGV